MPLTITRNGSLIKLDGDVDETAKFDVLKDIPFGPVLVDLEKVDRILSVGIREWVAAFSKVEFPIEYLNCPHNVVEQFNLIPELLDSKTKIRSLYARYVCPDCECIENVFLEVESPSIPTLPDVTCKCGDAMELDGDTDEFLSFMTDYRHK